MKAREIVAAPFRGLKNLTAMVFRPSSWSWRGWALPGSVQKYQALVGDGRASSTVMAPLQWIARNFPEAPVLLQREGPDGELESMPRHSMLRLLARPNEFYSGTTLWMATMLDWNTDGNAYWIKVRNGAGAVVELWWAPAALMKPKGSRSEFVTHYEYTLGADTLILDRADVVHLRFGLDPDDPRLGCSPLKSVLREIFTDDEAGAYTAALLRNSGVPGLVIAPKEGSAVSPDDVKATKAYLAEATTGERRGEPLVMSGPTQVSQFGFSPAQLDLRSLRRVPEERVTAVLGIPAIVAGLGAGLDRSTFANFGEAREAAYQENIIPAQRIIGEELRFQLLSDFESDVWGFRVGFDTSKVRVLQEDENERAVRLDTGVRGGWVRVDEARRSMGLPTEAGDEVYLRPFTALEVPAGEAGRTIEAGAGAGAPKARGSKGTHRPTREQAALIRRLESELHELSRPFSGRLRSAFTALGDLVADAFEEYAAEADLDFSAGPGLSGAAGPDGLKGADEEVAAGVLSRVSLDDWIVENIEEPWKRHYETVALSTEASIEATVALGVGLSDEAMRRVIYRGGTRLALLEVERSTRDAVIRSVADARSAGTGPIALARQIRDQVPAGRFVNAGPKYRAELIARTETKYAQNISSLENYRAADNVERVLAFDARLGDSDEDCEERDGRTFTFEDADRELSTEHPNGTLSFAPLVRDTL